SLHNEIISFIIGSAIVFTGYNFHSIRWTDFGINESN
uniref:CPBP family intramembrane metalloprotease n=1 Tax=Rodentolepis nana TaxID=102285 RepID=A0A0R3TS71_RODNA